MILFKSTKNNFRVLLLLNCTMLFFSCNNDVSKQSRIEKSIRSAKTSNSMQNNVAVAQSNNSVDTTTYIIDCLKNIIPNLEKTITAMEDNLVGKDVLINTKSDGYRDLFFKYLVCKDFGLYNTRDIHKGEKLYFEKKLNLAKIIQKNIQLFDNYEEKLNVCHSDQSKKEEFKKSAFTTVIKINTDFVNFIINDDVTTKYTLDTSLVTILENEFPIEYFGNKDVQYLIYFLIYLDLKTYGEEEKESEYIRAIEAIENYKNHQKKENNKVDIPEKNSSDHIEVEVITLSDEEAAENKKNGGIIEKTVYESDDNE